MKLLTITSMDGKVLRTLLWWLLWLVAYFIVDLFMMSLLQRYRIERFNNASGMWHELNMAPFVRLAKAITRCELLAVVNPQTYFRVVKDRDKVVFEHGKHRRTDPGNRSRAHQLTCLSCGLPNTRRKSLRRACACTARSGKRASTRVIAGEDRLFGQPLSYWRIVGLDCSCEYLGKAYLSIGRFQAIDSCGEVRIFSGSVLCKHYTLTDIDLFLCESHKSIFVTRQKLCACAGDFITQYRNAQAKRLPQVQGAIRAWRLYRMKDDGKLISLVAPYAYDKGVNVCERFRYGMEWFDNQVIGGFYCLKTIEEIFRQHTEMTLLWSYDEQVVEEFKTDMVIGSVLCIGGVKEGTLGYRAQKIIPENLVLADPVFVDYNANLLQASNRYGLKILSMEEAEKLPIGDVPFFEHQLDELRALMFDSAGTSCTCDRCNATGTEKE